MNESSPDRLIGQQIETECGKCKTLTLHTVTAVKDGRISRVMCNICNGYHNFRQKAATAAKTAATKTPRAPSRRTKMNWDSLILAVEEKEVKDYATSGDFRATKAIRHKTFGVGVITKVHTDNKIEVIFKEGTKLLGQNIDVSAEEGAMA